ncbi:polyprenyl synthetase family protein [Halobacillus naozhouensis]|uniref:Polyprenyl synthetase family protein n=1 Tax=Halobacillus naozhouensis TaxID=554880 RepID=A0ABY8IT87_9BACI|nr:farnesyl diphosphate synthase [Halobacillus naozhouensis]WFT73213.1 polyprenyl synthetase family protein [Halobacillus naozhouensis]
MNAFQDDLKYYQQAVNDRMFEFVNKYINPGRVRDAILHSIDAGGKRVRPILLLSTIEAFGADYTRGYAAACAIEMVHTYSLIHDDLPAMDDDDLRRGQPTIHKAFDEATAILAGDALLTLSFQVITEDPSLTSDEKVFLIRELSRASGGSGMVDGQMKDMLSEGKRVVLDELKSIHMNKTGQLLSFSIIAGAFLSHSSTQTFKKMEKMANVLGLIFQIQDDILDVLGDANAIGKPVGSDEGNEKSTYPQLLGVEGAIREMNEYVDIALQSLEKAELNHTFLAALIDFLSTRDR